MIATLARASERLPNWVRAVSLLGAWLSAVLVRFVYEQPAFPFAVALFVVLSLFALWAHVPALTFDGPLPFSDLGVHMSGEVHPWDEVETIAPLGDKDLQAVLADGRTVKLRVRGAHTREEFRTYARRHKPDAVAF
jgi:hypothetical protein